MRLSVHDDSLLKDSNQIKKTAQKVETSEPRPSGTLLVDRLWDAMDAMAHLIRNLDQGSEIRPMVDQGEPGPNAHHPVVSNLGGVRPFFLQLSTSASHLTCLPCLELSPICF